MPFSDVFPVTIFLSGTRLHLWFLPFAFVAALFLYLIHRATIDRSCSFNIVTAILIGATSNSDPTPPDAGGTGTIDIDDIKLIDLLECGPLPGDFNGDCNVDRYDLDIFIDHWLEVRL